MSRSGQVSQVPAASFIVFLESVQLFVKLPLVFRSQSVRYAKQSLVYSQGT